MLTNKQIKSKELYKVNQELLKVYGEMKKVQNDYLCATNEMAMAEYRKDNVLKKKVIELKFKSAIKNYFRVYARKIGLEEQRSALQQWKTED